MSREGRGAPPKRKATARGRSDGQENRSSTQPEYSSAAAKTRPLPAGSVEVYDGLRHVGSLVPKNGGWLAFTAEGRFKGGFPTDKQAAKAVWADAPRGQA